MSKSYLEWAYCPFIWFDILNQIGRYNGPHIMHWGLSYERPQFFIFLCWFIFPKETSLVFAVMIYLAYLYLLTYICYSVVEEVILIIVSIIYTIYITPVHLKGFPLRIIYTHCLIEMLGECYHCALPWSCSFKSKCRQEVS